MDFLLLLPHGQRVVLEVDGSQHYTRDRGQIPDTAKYAEMVAADRDLKLRGYEVFRFGHDELKRPDDAQALLRQFPRRTAVRQRLRRSGHGAPCGRPYRTSTRASATAGL
ncbi:hypothetical protein AB0P40_42210, partial [Streptomyces sp. NPDC079189]